MDNMTLEQVQLRIKELDSITERATTVEEVQKCGKEKKELRVREKELSEYSIRKNVAAELQNGTITNHKVLERNGGLNMDNNINIAVKDDLEVRSLQKYLVNGTRNLTEQEERSLDLSGAAAVVPTNIVNKLITDSKYSDLLNRATVINDVGAGKIYIPIASNVAAEWKTENTDLVTVPNTALTKLELGGFELMRLLQLSGAAASMSTGNFEGLMLELLGNEVIESLEAVFIKGTGIAQPKGLDTLTWTPNTNEILTASAITPIAAADLAEAISLLPQKYSRNAVILVNSDMMYQISQFKGTNEYAYNMAEGATRFLGKEIIVSEHMADDTIYIVDPKELYIRFSMPLQIEADRSVGFKSASIFLRALTVVDSVFNPSAAARVGLGA